MKSEMFVAELVLLARKRMGTGKNRVTQEKLAKLIGCSTAHLNSIETGRHQCSIKLLLRIAEVLGKKLTIKFE